MASVLTVVDESPAGKELGRFELSFPTERITVRELIHERVYQEVQDRELAARVRHVLVKPQETELALNGFARPGPEPRRREIDWKKQAEVACEAFERNGFFILVGDRQCEGLDETVEIPAGTQVSFVKLTPLVGG